MIKSPADGFELVEKQPDDVREVQQAEVQRRVDAGKDAAIGGPEGEAVKLVAQARAETVCLGTVVATDSLDAAQQAVQTRRGFPRDGPRGNRAIRGWGIRLRHAEWSDANLNSMRRIDFGALC